MPLFLRAYRNFTTTLIKLKDEKFETYYEMLGVPEDFTDGMQLEDAFVNVITGDEVWFDHIWSSRTYFYKHIKTPVKVSG